MNFKHITLALTVTTLAVVYAVYFTDWFRPKNIQIITQIRPMLQRGATQGTYPVAFGLNAKYRIDSIQVFSAKELATNELALPTWSLEGNPKSEPVKAFSYAGKVPGMKAAVNGDTPVQLKPGEEYTLIIESDGRSGRTNFVAAGKAAAPAQATGPAGLVPLGTSASAK